VSGHLWGLKTSPRSRQKLERPLSPRDDEGFERLTFGVGPMLEAAEIPPPKRAREDSNL
jgi:hypothetical protein